MTTSNLQVSAKGKSALNASTAIPARHTSRRPQRVSVKGAHRRNLPKTPRAISFAALAEDPIYRRIAREACPKDLAADITRYGFDSAVDIAACKSVPAMMARMARTGTRVQADDAEMRRLLSRSRREALRSYRLMRHELAVKEPMNQALRHTSLGSPDSSMLRSAQVRAYAKPTSLQSNQSPAAYLRYLYRIATGDARGLGISSDKDNPFALVNRRPDLAALVLNEANLKREVPTIELVNEVLRTGISDFDMTRHEQTVALPYDHRVTTTRTAMAALGGTSMNDIALRTDCPDLGAFAGYRWARDTAGLIGVLGAEDTTAAEGNTLLLVSEVADDHTTTPNTFGGLYPPTSAQDPGLIDPLMSVLGLDQDGIAQLFGLYTVAQESGAAVEQRDFATAFLNNAEPIKLRMTPDGKAVGTSNGPVLRTFNYLARLHHGTGLAFHDLNTLLALPGAADFVDGHPTSNHLPKRRVTDTGLRLLASYPLYKEAFNLTPAAFAALFGDISPYRRADQTIESDDAVPGLEQTEQSFMASLFHDDAPHLHRLVTEGSTPIADEILGAIVARGFGLSALELETLVNALEDGYRLTNGVDMRGLGALYRLVTLCRMLGWPILSGLALMQRISDALGDTPSLWATLTRRNETETDTDALCSAMDWLAELARWMTEADVSADSLLALLTPPSAGGVAATDADIAWFEGLATAYAPLAVREGVFADFTSWEGGQVSPDEWFVHVTGDGAICDGDGVFFESVTQEAIKASVRDGLIGKGIDPALDANADLLVTLVDRLAVLRDGQVDVIEAQVAGIDAQISAVSVTPFLCWLQTGSLDLLQKVQKGAGDSEARHWLAEIRRHVAVVTTFELGDVELAMLGHTPQWIAPELADEEGGRRPLDLAQLIWLQRFAMLQVAPATDAALQGYLSLVNADGAGSDMPDETRAQWVAGSRQTLALLLNCPAEDMAAYADALIGSGAAATTVAQIDLIARHVRLAAELNLSAQDLLALKRVSRTQRSADWTMAAAAAQAGLARFDDGKQMPGFRHRLAERERDALVAAFMQTRIAGDEDLKESVTNSEQLYSYLLLDVNVTSAVPTSRIVEAISSLQLFISRALAGLERGLSFTNAEGVGNREQLAAQWELDKDYRQWEANQKLMLYPQNYIEPELRQITSPEFDTLQRAVSGSDVTQDGVEAAVNAYMKGLAGVCDLSLCSLHTERHRSDGGVENATYHLLAKAKWEPGRFYYRKLDADYQTIADLPKDSPFLKAMDWTYWQEVHVPTTFDLFSEVTVCFFKNRYFFFWLELEERRVPVEGGDTPGAHKSLWRLHPRYMRCDLNALSGPMLTPGLFVTPSSGTPKELSVDGAFEWMGEKPVLNGTYHPTRAENGLEYGKLQRINRAASNETLMASFGITLARNVSKDDDKVDLKTHETALHVRLSDEWSDAILEWNGSLVTTFDNAAPDGYASVYPRPVDEYNAIADQGTTWRDFPDLSHFVADFRGKSVTAKALNKAGSTIGFFSFYPGAKHSGSLGRIKLWLATGIEELHINVPPGGGWSSGHSAWSKTTVDFLVTFTTSEGKKFEQPIEGLVTERNLTTTESEPLPGHDYIHDFHNSVEPIFEIPPAWTFDGAAYARLKVTAKIKREYKSRTFYYPNASGDNTRDDLHPVNPKVHKAEFTFAEFTLRPPAGKDNTGWVQTGQHGNRTFLHLAENPTRGLGETFVLMNSSSVMSDLAKSMPRPGGSESLFTLDNQFARPEDMGGFREAFEQTLRQLYSSEDDKGGVPDAHWPSGTFDFDSAYGAYGWEVFYHIPSAIAAGYASSGQFDLALQWLRRIFDPQRVNPWQVFPLIDAVEPTEGLAFDTGDVIVDPNRIARDYPFYYQQATIRNMLEVLLDFGDAEYEQQTQESLQRAKALYVSAKQLFSDNLPDTLDSLTNIPWTDPTLGEVAKDDCEDFLPPYNGELRGLYETFEARLFNLRHWLDLNGQPLNVPLLAQPIDPQVLQRTAKSRLSLGKDSAGDGGEFDSPLDFGYVLRSAKGYIGNLKSTSARLQSASEKEADSVLEEYRMNAAVNRSERAIDLQDFTIDIADMDVTIKRTALAKSSTTLANNVVRMLAKQAEVGVQTTKTAASTAKWGREKIKVVGKQISAGLKSTLPNTFGFSNGGQNLEQAEHAMMLGGVLEFLYFWNKKDDAKALSNTFTDATNLVRKTAELTAQVTLDSEELSKARKVAAKEKEVREELELQHEGAQGLLDTWNHVFGGSSFYKPFREDIEALYAEEWATTQDFCKLLVSLYQDETGLTNGPTFLRTTSLGSDVEKFNAPHRLALDIERLEMAYIQAGRDRAGQITELRFALSELPAVGAEHSALEELTTQGEVYFHLTDEMFDVFYPGQYDRVIQSINVCFPGLTAAGLSPHARLTQVSNTRFMLPGRDPAHGTKMRKNRHALQSIVIGACEIDTRDLDAPDGLLKRFQNTGVESCWHLAMPTVKELKRGKAAHGRSRDWRASAEKHHHTLKSHLTEVDFTIRFSGRWVGAEGLQY
ncbi:neuraminidase-like domain-containing protein [Thalassococcus sp. S3]|uniref:neuraminidase-like domain-containing protein n=1 Tax=Thalassococcus sp. S3 TaxID=2017482 RepID=UPI0010244085|nr:neuraminidase-like domain-containing protein [Thalassococcus sp. S3]QBF33360.1 toxin complex protein [Thalassococcus sp. S3]